MTVIDGPSPAIQSLGGLSIARDGTGGLVYLKGGHVVVSRVVNGGFQAPEVLDAALPAASSQPVIAAGNNGLLLVAFINGGVLYIDDRSSTGGPYSGPIALYTGASDPAISATHFGKAYLAFAAAGAGGHDVRAAYYNQGRWSLESAPLDAFPGDDAGAGAGRPDVVAAGDGVGIVVWGEAGRIYSRRIWGTAPSVVDEQADPAGVSGCAEISADQPVIGSGGDSSYAAVVFHELVACGAQHQSRVLMRRLRASTYEGVNAADGLSGAGADGAEQPEVAVGEFGRGIVTSARTVSHQLIAMGLGQNEVAAGAFGFDSLPNAGAPFAAPATAGTAAELVAWQRDPGIGPAEIRARFSPRDTFGSELVLSSPGLGSTAAPSGLFAAGASDGDAAVAWVQGTPGAFAIVTRELLQPPGSVRPAKAFRYVNTRHPLLTWTVNRARLGTLRYYVSIDGVQIGPTTATSIRVPVALRNGRHTWQVFAVSPAGFTTSPARARVFIDVIKPRVSVKLSATGKVGSPVSLSVRTVDLPRRAASGIAKVLVRWGDRRSERIRQGASHVYRRPGRYRVTVTVTDKAGNSARKIKFVGIGP